MSLPETAATGTVTLAPSRDGRLAAYALVAVGGFAGALLAGQPDLAALALPFALALALGLRRTDPVEVSARVVLDRDQVLEDDAVTGRLELRWSGTFDAHLMLHRPKGVVPHASEALSWEAPAARSIEVPLHLRAGRWGRHTLGEVWLRLEAPFGLLSWTGQVMPGPAVRVLPGSERLNRLLDPHESRAVWGMHRSVRLGDGHEFAELRPYAPGDRLRDLNWAATARMRRPFVNRHHPELAGEVVIALDALDDDSTASVELLARAARTAWALASVHLRANDRVGLLGLGGSTRWLPPTSGRLARYRLLETLLRIGGETSDRVMVARGARRASVPASALVIALTTLHDRRTLETLASWRANGRAVCVVMLDATDLLGEPGSVAESLARRLWLLELDRRRRELTGLGIPVVPMPVDAPATPVVSALRRARRAPGLRRGRR